MSEIYRKRQILKHIRNNPRETAKGISTALNVSIENAQMYSFRLFSQGLVDRETAPIGRSRKPCFAYTVNLRGEQRLNHWKTKDQQGKHKVRKRPEENAEDQKALKEISDLLEL